MTKGDTGNEKHIYRCTRNIVRTLNKTSKKSLLLKQMLDSVVLLLVAQMEKIARKSTTVRIKITRVGI